ncbi:AI-2E family transporter [Oscillatoria sp. CS-180]|uniref:AI-2E family transporter n=1 Tax=Oscillatoria sp. CS-180 TaxID=3021720 RepID=UPI00232BF509|nr:AI-2E family transporter [Oscillatoria sp. CS-180]MDB9524697.1 AI-2E family transporter [Oscillatoria sp. CS-180]
MTTSLNQWPKLPKAQGKLVSTLMIIITVILSIHILKLTRPVVLPIAFAFFIAVLAAPLQEWLERHLPKWVSMVVVLLVFGGVVGVFVGAVILSLELIEPKLPEYGDRLQQLIQSAQAWLSSYGLPMGENGQTNGAISQLLQQALGGVQSLLGVLSLLVLVASFLALLLLEIGQYRDRTQKAFPGKASDHIIHAVSSMGNKLRRYFMVVAFTSFLTGILTSAWCLILGVDLAFVWGLLAFILNFIPTLGSIIAAVVPALVATLFQGPAIGAATLVGLAIIQTILGNFVDPKLQGKYLKLSPFVALLSIVFWGWVWGIPGAFLGVPMTAAIVLFTNEFESSRSIAIMLGGTD